MSSNHRSDLTKVPIHGSLIRIQMFMGGERNLVITAMLFCGYMGYLLSMRFGIYYGLPVGGGLWAALLYLLRRMAKADAQMWAVMNRSKKYAALYPARGRIEAFAPTIKDFK